MMNITSTWLLPDWAPNAHPLFVHFPIALLTVAIIFDLLAFALKEQTAWRRGASALYVMGTTLMVVSYLSGREAAATVFTPGLAHGLVDAHWTWAMWTLGYFVLLTAGRLVAHYLNARLVTLWALFFVWGVGGSMLLIGTADRGGQLVYEYGVGVIGTR